MNDKWEEKMFQTKGTFKVTEAKEYSKLRVPRSQDVKKKVPRLRHEE